jgi:hypothetical protein
MDGPLRGSLNEYVEAAPRPSGLDRLVEKHLHHQPAASAIDDSHAVTHFGEAASPMMWWSDRLAEYGL